MNNEIIHAHRKDGTTLDVVIPTSRVDVEQQPGVPAAVLATLAFSMKINGVRRWSAWTLTTLRNLAEQYGDDTIRRILCDLLDDISTGFKPENPIGLLIHRVRTAATATVLRV